MAVTLWSLVTVSRLIQDLNVCGPGLTDALKCSVSCPCFSDVFKNATKLGTFPAILMTYTASALLHVSVMTH